MNTAQGRHLSYKSQEDLVLLTDTLSKVKLRRSTTQHLSRIAKMKTFLLVNRLVHVKGSERENVTLAFSGTTTHNANHENISIIKP